MRTISSLKGLRASEQFNRKCAELTLEEEVAKFRKFDKIILMQKDEMGKVLALMGADKLLLCPHSVESNVNFHIREEVETISFFGGPSWPNVDGMQWFHDLVLPQLGDLAQKNALCTEPLFAPHSLHFHRISLKENCSTLWTAITEVSILPLTLFCMGAV